MCTNCVPLWSRQLNSGVHNRVDFIDSKAKINFSRKGLHHKFIYTDLKNMTPLHAPKHKELGSLENRIE